MPMINWGRINQARFKEENEKWKGQFSCKFTKFSAIWYFVVLLDLPNLKKNFYIEDSAVAKMSESEVHDFWQECLSYM